MNQITRPPKAILEELVKTLTLAQLGEKFNAERTTVQKWLRQLNIINPRRQENRLAAVTKEQLAEAIKTQSLEKLSSLYRTSRCRLIDKMKKFGIENPRKSPRIYTPDRRVGGHASQALTDKENLNRTKLLIGWR